MRKASFTGITILNPGEGLDTDNYAFTGRDRELIDYGIKLGAKLHRHDGSEGLLSPINFEGMTATVVPSGGQIPAGLTINLGFTLEDERGGETIAGPSKSLTTGAPLQVPTDVPVTELNTASGALTVGTYYYAASYLDGEGGETPVGPTISRDRPPGYASATIVVKDIAVTMPEGAVSWRLYRAVNGGTYDLCAEGGIGEWVYDDGTLPVNCDVHPQSDGTNTTRQTNRITVKLPEPKNPFNGAEPYEQVSAINLYASLGAEFGESSLVGSYPMASAGHTLDITQLQFLNRRPPDVNTSFGGANKIDPDTELIEYHWKRPVQNKSELAEQPSPEEGDVRIVIDEHKAYILTKEGWEVWNQGGGGAAAGLIDVFMEGASDGGEVFEDTFSEGTLDELWEVAHAPEETPSSYFTESGALEKIGGGCPIIRKEATGLDARLVTKFGGAESFACIVEHLLRDHNESETNRLVAGYSGGFGHGNPAKIWIGLEGVASTFASSSFTEPAVGEYWIVTVIEGTVIRCGFYDEDPEGGAEPTQEVEADLADEGLEAPLEEREFFFGPGAFGLMFVGAPGGKVFDWRAEIGGSAEGGYVKEAAFIEVAGGDELAVASAVQGHASGARIVVPTSAMGFINCGESKAASRPDYPSVTWLLTAASGEPEHMQDGDFLVRVHEATAHHFVRVGGALLET